MADPQPCVFRPDVRNLRCGRPSEGTIGMLRICKRCFARLSGWAKTDPRLSERVTIQLHNDGEPVGEAEWVPDQLAEVE